MSALELLACPIDVVHSAHIYRPVVADPDDDHVLFVGMAEFTCPGVTS